MRDQYGNVNKASKWSVLYDTSIGKYVSSYTAAWRYTIMSKICYTTGQAGN